MSGWKGKGCGGLGLWELNRVSGRVLWAGGLPAPLAPFVLSYATNDHILCFFVLEMLRFSFQGLLLCLSNVFTYIISVYPANSFSFIRCKYIPHIAWVKLRLSDLSL